MKIKTLLKYLSAIDKIQIFTADQDINQPQYEGIVMDTPKYLLDYTIGIIENNKIIKDESLFLITHINRTPEGGNPPIATSSLVIDSISPTDIEKINKLNKGEK